MDINDTTQKQLEERKDSVPKRFSKKYKKVEKKGPPPRRGSLRRSLKSPRPKRRNLKSSR